MMGRAFVVVFALVASAPSVGDAQSRRPPNRLGLDERALLHKIVEDAAAGQRTAGNAWLKWTPHFLRGVDGNTYVPFTLTIEEAPGAFRTAAMYVRVAPRGDEGRAGKRAEGVKNAAGVATGELPVNSPERRQGVGAPTATDASLMLRSLTAKDTGTPYPFEAAYGVESLVDGNVATVRRAFAVKPGEYDVYIAIVERDRKGDKNWALLKQPLTVPNLAGEGLRVSSVILADRIEPLTVPVTAAEQAARPYALGAAELIPAADDELRQDETLHVAFLIYDAAVDAAGKPDVQVEYQLYQENFASDRLLGATPPQVLNRSTLPPSFDLRTSHQLAAMQSLPLTAYRPGTYRLAIRVVDKRSGSAAEEHIRFVIVS
jgi:hypothetical protein